MHSIYDLTEEWLTLMAALEATFDPETGEYVTDADEIEAAFDALSDDINAKLAGCGHVIRRFRADAAALAEEEKRLKQRRHRLDAARERLEERVRELMMLTNTRIAKTASITVSLSKPAKRVDVYGSVPARFWTVPVLPEPRPILADIARALKAGEDVPGAELVDGMRSLRIT